jgi:two-component system OmpR family sensor kinase
MVPIITKHHQVRVMTEETTTTNISIGPAADRGFFRHINVEFLIHELKDPISVIETAVRMLLEKPDKLGPLTDRQVKTLNRALRNSKKARSLLADLLEVGRSDAGCFQCGWFDPASILDEVLMEALEACGSSGWETIQEIGEGADKNAVLRQLGIHLTCSDGVCGMQLCQDEAKFRQIVGNLIKNALQHRRRRLDVGMTVLEDRLIVEVVDDGPGVEKENRELIFERYTRLKACAILSRTGHGLGLAGARILARHLGGDITVQSNRGTGAAFRLTLPVNLKEAIKLL